MEYWQPKAIFTIARGFRTPLSLDDCTMNKTRGFYARVLVDVDMANELLNQILVERPGFAFVTDIEYEKLSSFCSVCKLIGYSISDCRRNVMETKEKREVRKSQLVGSQNRQVVMSTENSDSGVARLFLMACFLFMSVGWIPP